MKLTKTAAVVGACLLATPAVAQAAPAATASATAGTVNLTEGAQTVQEGPVGECRLGQQDTASSPGKQIGGTRFGRSEAQCSVAADTGFATGMVRGQRFETNVLQAYGGPVLKIRSYSVRCDTTANGAGGVVELNEVAGITVPSTIEPNHTILVPGDEGKTVAKVVLNELIAPTPPDGSLVTNAMRIQLFPDGGPASGEIVVGSAACDPFA